MKSIGLCIGLLAMAVAAVLLVAPGSRKSKTELASADTVAPALRDTGRLDQPRTDVASTPDSSDQSEPTESVEDTPAIEPEATVEKQADAKPATQPVDPRTKGVVIKKSSAAARAKGEITFDDLQFDIEKDAPFSPEMLDEDVKSLDGLNVRLNGFILPATLFREDNIKEFVLVRDNQECCFGPGAALFDCVYVEMQDRNTTDFVTRPVTVHGKLVIDTEKYKYPGGKSRRGNASHLAIFRIEGVKVK